jgi:hypothetical protein
MADKTKKTKLDTRAVRADHLTSREVVSILGAQVGGLLSSGLAGEAAVVTALKWMGENAELIPGVLREMSGMARAWGG